MKTLLPSGKEWHAHVINSFKPRISSQKLKYFILSFFLFFTLFAQGQSIQTYTSSGTWICPAGVTSITVESWGGGGAGGGAKIGGTPEEGAGGGGGGYTKVTSVAVIPGTHYNVTVGAGGLGDAAGGKGGNGGNSYFNINTAIAYGGVGGDSDLIGNAGIGGVGSFKGGNGAKGSTSISGGGGGGAGSGGPGGDAVGGTGGTGATVSGGKGANGVGGGHVVGNNGNNFGGGGSGGSKGNNGNSHVAGGNGGKGQVVITYPLPPTITSLSANVCEGGSITIKGTNFTGITAANVKIGSTPVASITSYNDSEIVAVVAAASTGQVTVIATGGIAVSSATFTVYALPTVSGISTPTCVGGSTGTITASAAGGTTPYTYSLNSGAYQPGATFSGLSAGTYTLHVKSNSGCIASTTVTVSPFANSTDDQNAAGSNSWIGHMYSGTNFQNYIGHFTEPEIFNEGFGGDLVCFNVTSNSTTRSIYTETFSARFRMNSTRKGLYIADIGSDDGSRLTVDGTLIFDNWVIESYLTKPGVLMNLTGNSSLNFEYYENTGANEASFLNFTLVLANSLSTNTSQNICLGSTGSTISGDTYGTLPSGITLSGTGYQWSYSTTPGGSRINIPGATSVAYTPNTSIAPFNIAGTYYIYRNAILSSGNNVQVNPYVAANESNAAIIVVSAVPSATISYSGAPYCNTISSLQPVTLSGTLGGVFTAIPSGLSINTSSGAIMPSASTIGNYVVSYTVSTPGCSTVTARQNILIGYAGMWHGMISSDWSDSENWVCNQIPTPSVDVFLPKGSLHYPVSISNLGEIKNLKIDDGSSLMVGGTLKIFGDITNNGVLDVTSGTLEMAGLSAQTIAGSMFAKKTLKSLIVSNLGSGLSVSSTLNDTLKISGTLSFGNTGSKLNTGDNITLLSTNKATANVGIVGSGNLITGKVIAERYINIGPGAGQHAKSWNLLSAPITGQTIKESWMENGLQTSAPNGYGTWITDPAGTSGGFDANSVSPSMKTYVSATNSWLGVSNPTTTSIQNEKGYLLFIRGDRSVFNVSGVNSSPVAVTLRAKGNLVTGDRPAISILADKFESIGNPYASKIDFTKIIRGNGVDDIFYVWDPLLYGYYGYGGYQTLSSVNDWKPVPGATGNYPSDVACTIIQSGQAFFVHATSGQPSVPPNYTISFSENSKFIEGPSGGRAIINRRGTSAKRQFLGAGLYSLSTEGSILADANVTAFDDAFSNIIDGNDALKLLNSGENFGVKREGKLMVIEARKPVSNMDTIYYNLSNLKAKNYQVKLAPQNMMGSGVEAYLIDKYLKVATPVSLSDSSYINFTVTADEGSYAADRLMVIFKPMAPLPVTFTSVKANLKNADIMVEWKVENESNMKQYEVEKSVDGNKFTKAATIEAINGRANDYNWLDQHVSAGNNFYRILSIDVNGKFNYSQVVKVLTGKQVSEIMIYPNPIINGTINLNLTNQPAGMYGIRILNDLGQVILSKQFNHAGGNSIEIIKWDTKFAKGVYQLEVIKPSGEKDLISIMQ